MNRCNKSCFSIDKSIHHKNLHFVSSWQLYSALPCSSSCFRHSWQFDARSYVALSTMSRTTRRKSRICASFDLWEMPGYEMSITHRDKGPVYSISWSLAITYNTRRLWTWTTCVGCQLLSMLLLVSLYPSRPHQTPSAWEEWSCPNSKTGQICRAALTNRVAASIERVFQMFAPAPFTHITQPQVVDGASVSLDVGASAPHIPVHNEGAGPESLPFWPCSRRSSALNTTWVDMTAMLWWSCSSSSRAICGSIFTSCCNSWNQANTQKLDVSPYTVSFHGVSDLLFD